MANLFQSPGQRADKTYDRAHDAEDNRASPVRGDGVHHDAEGEDMAAHDEDEEEDLGAA